jgi:thiamine biosynthesis lipoprotein
MRGYGWWAGALVALAAAAGCTARGPVEATDVREAMSTLVMVRAIAPDDETASRALKDAWAELDFCAAKLSRYEVKSDISRINQDAGQAFLTEVDPVTVSCLAAAKEVHDLTGGAFNPTVGPVLDLWREAEERGREPADEELQAAVALAAMDKVEIHAFTVQPYPVPRAGPPADASPPAGALRPMNLVGLYAKGMKLDLGGIAKGYIAGRMARRMQQAGASAGLVAAGGDVFAFNERPPELAPPGGDRRWGVGVQDPRYGGDRKHLYSYLHIRDQAVDTSGHYERGYAVGGTRYSHIVDPRTGRPVNRALASVTVVAPDPATADALATGIAVLGVEKGLALVEKLPGVECLLLEVPEAQLQEPDPAKVELIAHRSSGFAALEFTPGAAAPPHH